MAARIGFLFLLAVQGITPVLTENNVPASLIQPDEIATFIMSTTSECERTKRPPAPPHVCRTPPRPWLNVPLVYAKCSLGNRTPLHEVVLNGHFKIPGCVRDSRRIAQMLTWTEPFKHVFFVMPDNKISQSVTQFSLSREHSRRGIYSHWVGLNLVCKPV